MQDKRLIIILSNCNHTMVRVIPRLVENLNKHGYVEMERALRVGYHSNVLTQWVCCSYYAGGEDGGA